MLLPVNLGGKSPQSQAMERSEKCKRDTDLILLTVIVNDSTIRKLV